MLKFIAILTGCSLTLTVSVQAAKPEDPNKKPAQKTKTAQKQQVAPKQGPAPKTHVQAAPKTQRPAPKPQVQAAPKTERPANTVRSNAPKKQERTAPAVESSKAPTVDSKKTKTEKPERTAPAADSSKAPTVDSKKTKTEKPEPQTKQAPTNVQASTAPATSVQPKKAPLDKQTVKKIQAQHTNFKAQPNTAITSAQFNPNYRIEAAQNWSGPQYEVFRSYQPQWHDQTWWRSRYSTNLSLIAGGWYYWDSGYWYPAWGYDDSADYYPYDGPIYVGDRARPFDQVVADVQAVLQEQGFYRGEVDGLVGPLTREALSAYQSAQGLPPTAAIDQPTLDSLGLT